MLAKIYLSEFLRTLYCPKEDSEPYSPDEPKVKEASEKHTGVPENLMVGLVENSCPPKQPEESHTRTDMKDLELRSTSCSLVTHSSLKSSRKKRSSEKVPIQFFTPLDFKDLEEFLLSNNAPAISKTPSIFETTDDLNLSATIQDPINTALQFVNPFHHDLQTAMVKHMQNTEFNWFYKVIVAANEVVQKSDEEILNSDFQSIFEATTWNCLNEEEKKLIKICKEYKEVMIANYERPNNETETKLLECIEAYNDNKFISEISKDLLTTSDVDSDSDSNFSSDECNSEDPKDLPETSDEIEDPQKWLAYVKKQLKNDSQVVSTVKRMKSIDTSAFQTSKNFEESYRNPLFSMQVSRNNEKNINSIDDTFGLSRSFTNT